jgi:hypothetical protein
LVAVRSSSGERPGDVEDAAREVGRREVIGAAAMAGMGGLLMGRVGQADAYTQVEVGAFLPASKENPDFVQFKASPKDTPALRAGER